MTYAVKTHRLRNENAPSEFISTHCEMFQDQKKGLKDSSFRVCVLNSNRAILIFVFLALECHDLRSGVNWF